MKTLKKMLAVFLAITCCGICEFNIAKASGNKFDKAMAVINGLGIMDSEQTGENITRAEFSDIVFKILNYEGYDVVSGEWASNFYGNKDEQPSTTIQQSDEVFYSDVDDEMEFYDSIMFLTQSGYMVGFDDGTFRPDELLTDTHAATVLIKVLGYGSVVDVFGGYDEIASNLGIITLTDNIITRNELARLIYNCLGTHCLEFTFNNYDLEDGPLMIEKYLKMNYHRGIMTDNGITSLTGKSNVSHDMIMVDDIELYDSEGVCNKDFLARDIEVYYKAEDSENELNVVYACLSERDEIITISSEEFIDFSEGVLTYEVGKTEKRKIIQPTATIIFNNETYLTYGDDIFDIENGTITLISSNSGDNIDYVTIRSYESVVVGGIDLTNRYITNKIRYLDSNNTYIDNTINLDEEIFTIVKNDDGTAATLEDIKEDAVIDISISANYIEIIICDSVIFGFTVKEISNDEGVLKYTDGTNEYMVTKTVTDCENPINVTIGKTYTVSLNSFGKIARLINEDDDEIQYGLLLKALYDEDTEQAILRILDKNNERKTIIAASKVVFSNEEGKEIRYKEALKLCNVLNAFEGQLVRFKFDKDKYLNYIEVPITNPTCTTEGKLRFAGNIGKGDINGDGDLSDPGEVCVWMDSGQIGFDFLVKRSVICLTDNIAITDVSDEQKYTFSTGSFLTHWGEYAFKAYTTKYDSYEAEYIIREAEYVAYDFLPTNQHIAVVTDINEELDEYDEPVLAVTLCDSPISGTASQNVKMSAKDNTVIKQATDMLGNGTYTVEKGDIIKYILDVHGRISQVRILWKSNINGFYANEEGGIPGFISYYDENSANGAVNPYGFVNKEWIPVSYKASGGANERGLYGFVYDKQDNLLRITTQDLSAKSYDKMYIGDKYVTMTARIPTEKQDIIVLTINGKHVEAKYGTMEDVKSYKLYGSKCSRIFAIYAYDSASKFVVINRE